LIKTFKIITGKEKANASDFVKFSEGINLVKASTG